MLFIKKVDEIYSSFDFLEKGDSSQDILGACTNCNLYRTFERVVFGSLFGFFYYSNCTAPLKVGVILKKIKFFC